MPVATSGSKLLAIDTLGSPALGEQGGSGGCAKHHEAQRQYDRRGQGAGGAAFGASRCGGSLRDERAERGWTEVGIPSAWALSRAALALDCGWCREAGCIMPERGGACASRTGDSNDHRQSDRRSASDNGLRGRPGRLIALCQSPEVFAAAQGRRRAPLAKSFREMVEALIPEMAAGGYEPFRLDIASRGLIVSGAEAVMESRRGPYARLTTALGVQFLRFIEDATHEEGVKSRRNRSTRHGAGQSGARLTDVALSALCALGGSDQGSYVSEASRARSQDNAQRSARIPSKNGGAPLVDRSGVQELEARNLG